MSSERRHDDRPPIRNRDETNLIDDIAADPHDRSNEITPIDDDMYENGFLENTGNSGVEVGGRMIDEHDPKKKKKIDAAKDWAREHGKTIAIISGVTSVTLFFAGGVTVGVLKYLENRKDVEVIDPVEEVSDDAEQSSENTE